MPGLNIQVALSEALEVRGGPLTEREIWAVLRQSVESLQDLFIKGHAIQHQGPAFAVTPDTIMVGEEGFVSFAESSFDSLRNKDFVPPEWNPRQYFTDEEVEKIFVFALGVSIYTSADFHLPSDQALNISDELDRLLGEMCEDDPTSRMNFIAVLNACSDHFQRDPNKVPSGSYISRLYRLVLGSDPQLGSRLDNEGQDYITRSNHSRRALSQERPHSAGPRTRSRSRSQPRSRSHSADRYSMFSTSHPRPVPLGHDQPSDHYLHHRKYPSVASLHSNKHNRGGFHFVPHYFGSQPNLVMYDPYFANAVPHYGGRKIVGQSTKGDNMTYPPYNYGEGIPGGLIQDPHVRQMYERLKERQRKLQALRQGLDLEALESPDAMSTGSEDAGDQADRRSVMSAHSYTQGVYQPGLYQKYGLSRALHMGHERVEGDTSDSTNDEAWIRQQEEEIMAMQRAIENFTGPRLQESRQSRSRTKTPVGSRPGSRPSSRPSSRPGSRPESRTRSEGRSRSRPKSRSKSRGERRVPNKTPRKFYGPEFIQSDRVIQITVPTLKTTNRSHLRHVFVHLLNGEKLDVTCEHSTPGKDLYDAVVAHLGLPEHYLFGITYAQDGEYYFIEGDQKLSKMAPSHWKDPGKGKTGIPFTTYFRVKFYVENVTVLQHQVTRHLFYLQLRKDMLEDKISCNEEQALNMAGFAMQAEYGDWYDKAVGFIPEVYLPPRIMKRIGKAYAKETIPKQHRKHCGLSDDKAEILFIKEVTQLTEYGIHFYKVYHSKKDIGNPVWTGISVQGILMAEQQGSTRVTTQRHPWQFTQKVSFSRHRFSITPKSDMGGMKLHKLNYYTDSYKKGRYLLNLSTAHHRFQIMMRQRIEPNLAAMIEEEYPLEAGEYDYEESEYLDEDLDDENDDQQYEGGSDGYYGDQYGKHPGEGRPRSQERRMVNRSHDQRDQSPDLTTGEESEDTLQDNYRMGEDRLRQGYDSLPQRERPHSRISSKNQTSSQPNTPGSSRPVSRPTTPGAHVIDVSFRSYDSAMELNQYLMDREFADLTDPLFQSISKTPPPPTVMSSAASVERRVAIVELAKVPKYGIGLTVVGGENTGRLDLGIFVKSITPGGPADLSGNIQAGDRIIAINGHSLEGMPHHKAVELIRDSSDIVQLLISQPVEPYSGNGTLDIDSDASLMDDLNSPKIPPVEFQPTYTSHNNNMSKNMERNSVTSRGSLSLSQLNAVLQRTASVNSSDLELEDVVPPEALQPHYVETHKSPASPYINTEVYNQMAEVDGRLSAEYAIEGGRRSIDYSIEGMRKMSAHTLGGRPRSSGYPDTTEESDDCITSTNRTDTSVFDGSYDHQMSSPPESPSAQSSARTVESLEHLQPGDVYEMVLRKQSNSLGLNVAGGSNTTVRDGGIYVKSLASKGAADLDTRIHVGDKVLEVNGVSLSGSTHKQAVEALRSAPLVCHLLMERGVPPTPKATSPQPSTTPTVTPSVAAGLSSIDTASTLASQSMRTDEGVASPSIRSETTTNSVNMNNSVAGMMSAIPDQEVDVYGFVKPDNTYAVELNKSSTGLGFSVLGGSDAHPDPVHCLVRVKKIFPYGPAHDSGLEVGDVILQVDNVKLRGLTNKEVMTVLRSSPPTVRLIVSRPESGVLPSIEELRRSLLDNTMDSETNVPVAISTPTEDLILNEQKPSFTNETDEPIQEMISPNPIHSSHAYQYSDSESLATPRETPDHTVEQKLFEEETESESEEETETECHSGRTETETQSLATESHVTTSTQNRTPSPVKTFLQDAGLNSYETTPAATPSVEQQINSARSGMSSSVGIEQRLDEEEETGDEEEMPSHVFEVTLTKEEKGLGFTVAGGSQTTGFFYVKDILYNPAKADGRIQPGDRLIMVNGQDMTNMQHKEAVVFLRQTPQTVTLVFERQVENDSDVTPTPSPRVPHNSNIQGKEQSSVKNLISSLESSGQQVIKPYLYKKPPQQGELSPRDAQEEEVTKKVVQGRKGTPKALEDSLEDDTEDESTDEKPTMPKVTVTVDESQVDEGDERQVHTPNPDEGHFLNTSRDDVMSTASSFGNVTLPLADLDESVKQEPEVKQITIKERAPTPEGANNNLVVRIQLKKPSTGSLGFTLVQGEKGLSSALFVRSIAPGSVAERDGRLRINDKLLQVNGESVIGVPHNKAVALVKKATGIVNLAISRCESRPPSTRNTPAPTPSGEIERSGEDTIDTIEMEDQEDVLKGLIKAVTPGEDKHCDTDSDVDSATLDETNDDWGSSPRSGYRSANLDDTNGEWGASPRSGKTVDSDGEEVDQFNEGTNAYRNFMETKGGVKREEAPAYRGKLIERVNQEKALTRFNRVPSRVSDEWLATLDVISPPDNNVHYSGRELKNTLKALKVKIERDDPVEEYKGLRHHKLTDNCIAARKPENKSKNRYRNVLPYDATRVCLMGTDDYINASHVKYQVSKKQLLHYIATQGPMPETTGDFWRMIWELKVEIIAMVTQDMEGGKVKCHRYWPDSMTTPMTILDRYEVQLKSVQCLEHLDMHQICVTDTETGDTHLVTHINFTTWPDHGTPDSGLPIMQYIKLMHLLHDSGPIVVHCSAGIGRTGALITLDIARALIDSDLKFDIQKIVQEIRRQRQGMIQTKDQYRFCYKTVMETLTTLNAGLMSLKSMGDTL